VRLTPSQIFLYPIVAEVIAILSCAALPMGTLPFAPICAAEAHMPSRSETLTVEGSEMRCHIAIPDVTPAPAVVVAQHAGGVDAFIRLMTDRFAEAGFVAIAPALYHRQTSSNPQAADDAMTMMSRLRDDEIAADCNAAIAHLKTMSEVRADRIGVTGFCMGGRVAYLMATRAPDLKAAVVFYGGNIMTGWGSDRAPFADTDKIGCPVLGLFGEEDGNPNPADVAKIDAELTRLNKHHEFHTYSGAGHAFMNEGRPSHRPETAADAWQRAISFFKQHLG
jgi:carboxymethylenebutenolidase